MKSNKIVFDNCSIKHGGRIGTNLVSINYNFTVKEPLDEPVAHVVFYYKYTIFRKFPIDLWQNLCEILNPKKQVQFFSSSFKPILPHIQHDGKLECPLMGSYAARITNLSLNQFDLPSLIPAGKYRIDVNITENNRKNVILLTRTYVNVPDNRIEQL